jgi:hypothetical protein
VVASRAWIDALAAQWAPLRPPHRRHVPLARTQGHALLLDDATRLCPPRPGTLAIELKVSGRLGGQACVRGRSRPRPAQPKWGYLPRASGLAAVKRAYCRFCLHRALKRATLPPDEQAAQVAHDAYCPLSLYARDPARVAHGPWQHPPQGRAAHSTHLSCMHMHTLGLRLGEAGARAKQAALQALLRGPGNNLRLFLDGRRSDDADALLATWLPWVPPAARVAAWAQVVAAVLTAEPLVPTLARAQQALDALDIEGVYPVYEALAAATAGGTVAVEDELRLSTPAQVDAYVSAAVRGDDRGPWGVLRRSLVAATLKDCSILIALALSHDAAALAPSQQRADACGQCLVVVDGRPVAVTYQMRGTWRFACALSAPPQ